MSTLDINDPATPAPGDRPDPSPGVPGGELPSERDYTRRPLPVVLPLWLRSPATARATLRWALRYTARHLGFHAVRVPSYGLALCWWSVRGAARGLATALRWVTGRREYRPLITAAQEARRWDLVRELIIERRALAQTRITTTAWLTLSAGATTAAGFLTWGRVFLGWAGAGVVLGSLWLGRPRTTPVLPAGPVLPVALELSADMLTGALRAAGLVKADAIPQLVTPPLRDGNGWAVTLDLPRGGGKTAADAIAKRDTVAAELGVDEIQVIMSRVRAAAGGHAGRLMIWVADDDPYLGEPNLSPLITLDQFSV
ncbi:MAG TPA: hypothetical protein VFO16_00860, partial [Pseudonocardiaceae bacterium]|nr:hypothetical protein [Pseudonocardiaceae bacterium]